MVIVTTDHGRNESGHDHGGQLNRERSVWISTNIRQLNRHFTHASLSLVDIQPTLSRFMGFEVPQEVAFERDGISFSALPTSTTSPHIPTTTRLF